MNRILSGIVIGIGCLLQSPSATGQENEDLPNDHMSSWESLIEEDESTNLAERLNDISTVPVDLNHASLDELSSVPGIEGELAERIVAERERKPFTLVQELLRLDGVTRAFVSSIRPFVTVRQTSGPSLRWDIRSQVRKVLQPSVGYVRGDFLGSPVDQSTRVAMTWIDPAAETRPRRISSALIVTKDAGEPGVGSFVNGFVRAEFPDAGVRLHAGSFLVGSGQGIAVGYGRTAGKSADPVGSFGGRGNGIHSVAASDESNALRGAAVEWEGEHCSVRTAWALAPLHGSVDSLGRLSSIFASGLFRTPEELRRSRAATHEMRFIEIGYGFDEVFRLRVAACRSRFDKPLALASLRDQGRRELGVVSGSAEFTLAGFSFLIESAADQSGGRGMTASVLCRPSPGVRLAIAAREYTRGFFSMTGRGVAEQSSHPQNERGWYVGSIWQLNDQVSMSGSFDQFMFPERSAARDIAGFGHDLILTLHGRFTHRTSFQIRWRTKEWPEEGRGLDQMGRTVELGFKNSRRSLRAELSMGPAAGIECRSRMEWVRTGTDHSESGLMIFQEFSIEPEPALKLSARMAFYRTDSYASRITAVEQEFSGVLPGPPLYGQGIRTYAGIRWMVRSGVVIAVRFSRSFRQFAHTMGSGLDEVPGDHLDALAVQLEYHR